MTVLQDAASKLDAAIATVTRTYRPGDTIDPPAAVASAPAFRWENFCADPSHATYTVFVFVPFDERAVERLIVLAIDVANAINDLTDAVVTEATPSTFVAGSTELPVYELVVEYALNG